jgi:hypothetical protein
VARARRGSRQPDRVRFWRGTRRVRATSAWAWPAATAHRPADAFERLAVAQAAGVAAVGRLVSDRPGCQQSPDHVIRRGEPLYRSIAFINSKSLAVVSQLRMVICL